MNERVYVVDVLMLDCDTGLERYMTLCRCLTIDTLLAVVQGLASAEDSTPTAVRITVHRRLSAA